MKASEKSRFAHTNQAGLILLFAEKLAVYCERPRRAQPNRYPDFGLEPRSRLPATLFVNERRGGYWEFVARYSGATVPDSHRIP